MKGQTELAVGDSGTATLGAAGVGRGLFQTRVRFGAEPGEAEESGQHPIVVGHRAFSRRVGIQYSLQVILNSLPLLFADIGGLTATIVVWRLIFRKLAVLPGIDVSACLLPIAIGFVLLNFELDLYPGLRLGPVEELRRLVVSVTCMFVMWALAVTWLYTPPGMQHWFLLFVYLSCLLTLPILRSWMRRVLGRYSRWVTDPALHSGLRHFFGRYTSWGIPAPHLWGRCSSGARVSLACDESALGIAARRRNW